MKVKNIQKVVGPMPVRSPFILSAYHYDRYPAGNGKMGPNASLAGKNIGNDFDRDAEWRMYHGEKVPGFPHHPHRGFEIVTIVSEGYADHFDSKGSKGRYGNGDVQLMSAGEGVLHAEMFPLLNDDKGNDFRLFQIWLNLPAKSKLTEPAYKMIWNEQMPTGELKAENGAVAKFKVILGAYHGVQSLGALPHSWAKDPNNHVGIALVELEPNAEFTLEAVSSTMNRFVFFYDGTETINIDGYRIQNRDMADLAGDEKITIKNEGSGISKILILEGEPINEPVAAYGPFVMNTQEELQDAFKEYQRTEFGGWPWGDREEDLLNEKDAGRFASYNFGETIDKP